MQPYSAETKALRTVARTRDDIVDMRLAATNQLSALLDDFWPGAKEIFADVESPMGLAFLRRHPTATAAARLGERRLTAFLTKHGYSGRRPASALLARLRLHVAGKVGSDQPLATVIAPELAIIQTIDDDVHCDGMDAAAHVKAFGASVQEALQVITRASPRTRTLMITQPGRPSAELQGMAALAILSTAPARWCRRTSRR